MCPKNVLQCAFFSELSNNKRSISKRVFQHWAQETEKKKKKKEKEKKKKEAFLSLCLYTGHKSTIATSR